MKLFDGKSSAIWGSVLFLSCILLFPLLVAAATHWDMRDFDMDTHTTSPPLDELIASSTVIVMFMGAIGFLLLNRALFAAAYRAKWFFWGFLSISLLIVWTSLPGAIIGGIYLLVLFAKRGEFFPSLFEHKVRPEKAVASH